MGVNQPQARPRRQVRALVSRCARSRRPHPPAEPRFNPARPRGAAGPPAPSGAEPPPPPPDTERCGAERGLPYPGTGAAGGRGNLSAAIAPPEPLLVLRQPPPGQPPPQLPPAPSPSPLSPHSPTAPTVFPPPPVPPQPPARYHNSTASFGLREGSRNAPRGPSRGHRRSPARAGRDSPVHCTRRRPAGNGVETPE